MKVNRVINSAAGVAFLIFFFGQANRCVNNCTHNHASAELKTELSTEYCIIMLLRLFTPKLYEL